MTEFWSCKINRPDTLKKHRLFSAAIKKAGDHGFVFDAESNRVFQVMEMADGSLTPFDVEREKEHCNTGRFDMRAALADLGVNQTNIN
jgi:hypothetical protein